MNNESQWARFSAGDALEIIEAYVACNAEHGGDDGWLFFSPSDDMLVTLGNDHLRALLAVLSGAAPVRFTAAQVEVTMAEFLDGRAAHGDGDGVWNFRLQGRRMQICTGHYRALLAQLREVMALT